MSEDAYIEGWRDNDYTADIRRYRTEIELETHFNNNFQETKKYAMTYKDLEKKTLESLKSKFLFEPDAAYASFFLFLCSSALELLVLIRCIIVSAVVCCWLMCASNAFVVLICFTCIFLRSSCILFVAGTLRGASTSWCGRARCRATPRTRTPS